jgi:hypothetical protein
MTPDTRSDKEHASLLPCPFCGAAPKLHPAVDDSGHQPVECETEECPLSRLWPDLQTWQRRVTRSAGTAFTPEAEAALIDEVLAADPYTDYEYAAQNGAVEKGRAERHGRMWMREVLKRVTRSATGPLTETLLCHGVGPD